MTENDAGAMYVDEPSVALPTVSQDDVAASDCATTVRWLVVGARGELTILRLRLSSRS